MTHDDNRSVDELIDAIEDYLSARNDAPTPFVWTKTADAIREKRAPLYAAQ